MCVYVRQNKMVKKTTFYFKSDQINRLYKLYTLYTLIKCIDRYDLKMARVDQICKNELK